MATLPLVILLALACLSAALPKPPVSRNTIFADEKLDGEIFYNIDNEVVPTNDYTTYRLPTTTRPIHYDVYIWTDFESQGTESPRMFGGTVNIQLTATQANVNEIVLQLNELNIKEVELSLQGTVIPTDPHVIDNPLNHHFLRIRLRSGSLQYNANNNVVYVLKITYDAPMRKDMYGIYESWYKVGNDIKWMATTQFQATAARSAFPCYDEPSFKATFDFTIRRPASYKSWSCTRISSSRPYPDNNLFEEDIYTRTPIMSTYLIAIIVADYGTTNTDDILKYEVIARHEAIADNQAEYANEVGQELLAKMNYHTDIDFYSVNPNLKMTQAAIPDFGAGAMENWGLLTYREAYLMYHPEHSDSMFKQRIAYILSHEIAHMWFGNLVTCDWWSVLWLNEGFARYYQYYLTHWVETEMGFDTRFVIEQTHSSLLFDSSNNPHPLTNPRVGSPASVSAMFSTISYNKGACIIRMTEHLLGHEVHRRGLQNYLRANEFKTAKPEDLFKALEDEAVTSGAITEYGPDFSVTEYYKRFSEYSGHPILFVDVNHRSGKMTIRQRRFNINSGWSNTGEEWIIPFNFATASKPDFTNTKPTHVLSGYEVEVDKGSLGDEWVIFNIQQTGYYRVMYDDYTWNLITLALRGNDRTLIHEHNRGQIVNDVFQYARAGLMTYTRALNILSFLEFETAYAPWVAAITGFNWIRSRYVGHPLHEEIEKLIVKWGERVMNDIGYEETGTEPFMRSFLRYQLAPVMCQLNAPGCRTAANRLFTNLRDNNVQVPVDSRIWVYCNALRQGSVSDFNFLWNRFLTHNVYTEKILLLQTLGCTPHEASLKILIDSIVEDNYEIRKQDYTTALSVAVSGNEDNRNIVFNYIKDNMEKVRKGFGSLRTPLSYISSRLRSEEEIRDFVAWADSARDDLGSEYQAIVTGATSSLESIQWAEAKASDFKEYLDNGYQEVQTTTDFPVTPAPPNESYRLPKTTEPIRYEVSLTPYFEDAEKPFSFDGEVAILLQATTAGVTQIVMHCNDLQIHTLELTLMNDNIEERIDLRDIAPPTCDSHSFLKINTVEPLLLDRRYIVRMTFTGRLQTNMRGFYRSWYIDSTNKKRWMATTQFQPGHARQAFPCYDEPSFKAHFDITINREADFSETISNMPRRMSVVKANGRIAESFHTTPKTSTYLLAFIVSHYSIVARSTNNPRRPFEIYARDNAGNTGDWSLEIGKELLEEMEDYTSIPYYTMQNNMNMKQAAIPDFSAGAMENWGLLTYREALILYDPENSNHNYKQRVANIVSHEIAHMWFGNLVTCAWWDNLWLNEGFARFYQYFTTDSVRPDMGYEPRFLVEQHHVALFADSVDSAHPMTDPTVEDPASVSAHFSTITYARGATILRMTQYLLGKSTFIKGLRTYLKERSYDVAEPHHLFSALDRAAQEDNALANYQGLTIADYFPTWSVQAGHPLLTIQINRNTGLMTLTQRRWERNGKTSEFDSLYNIPLTWTRASAPDFEDLKPSQVMTTRTVNIQRGTTGLEWVIFNKQQSGFYRINYDDANWVLLTRALRGNERTTIHEYNKGQIVDDLFALARAGVKDYKEVFNILSFLKFDNSYVPWVAAISGFNFLRRRLAHDGPELAKLDEMIVDLSSAITGRLGYAEREDEPFMDGLLRMYLMTFLCNVGHEQCVTAGTTSFRNYIERDVFIPANMRPWVYCTGLRNGNAADFDKLWDKYINDDLSGEKIVILEALGCTRDAGSLRKYLDNIIADNDSVRAQDFNTAMNSATSGNEENTQVVFDWLKQNLAVATERLGSVSTLLGYISGRLLTEQQITEFTNWVRDNEAQLGAATVRSALNGADTARSNLEWSDERVPEMLIYFEEGYQDVILDGEGEGETPPPDDVTPAPEPEDEPTTPDSASVVKVGLLTIIALLSFVIAF